MLLSWILILLVRTSQRVCYISGQDMSFCKYLEEMYGQCNKARLFQIQQNVICLTQGHMDIGY